MYMLDCKYFFPRCEQEPMDCCLLFVRLRNHVFDSMQKTKNMCKFKYSNCISSKFLSSKDKKVCSLKLLVFMTQKNCFLWNKILSDILFPLNINFLFPTIKVNTLMYSNIFILKKREKHDEKGCRAL